MRMCGCAYKLHCRRGMGTPQILRTHRPNRSAVLCGIWHIVEAGPAAQRPHLPNGLHALLTPWTKLSYTNGQESQGSEADSGRHSA